MKWKKSATFAKESESLKRVKPTSGDFFSNENKNTGYKYNTYDERDESSNWCI